MTRPMGLCLLLLSLVASPAGAATMRVLDVPRLAPDFSLPTTDGGEIGLSQYRGRYVLINFWAVWCTPCRKEMPAMQRSFERLRDDGIDMLAIHSGPRLDDAARVAGELGLGFTIAVDEALALHDWEVQGLPTTYLVDPQGRIVADAVGIREWDSDEMIEWLRGTAARPAADRP